METRGRRRAAAVIVLGAILCVALVLLVALAPDDTGRARRPARSAGDETAETPTRQRVHERDTESASGADATAATEAQTDSAALPHICRLDVRVISDVDERPVPEAAVVFEDTDDETFTGTTDDTGTAILRDVSWSAGRLRVTAPGYATAVRSVGASPLGGRLAVTVRLRDAIPLRVIVRDSWTGDGVAHARVRVFEAVRGGGRRGEDPGPLLAEAVTAEDGGALLETVPNGACVISVTGDGLETSETGLTRNETRETAQTITVWTSPGGVVSGRVLRADGSPVRDARVRLGWGRSNEFEPSHGIFDQGGRALTLQYAQATETVDLWRPIVTRSDEEGRFRIEGIRRGPGFYVAALDGQDRALSTRSHLRFTRETAEIEIDLVADGSVNAEDVSDGASGWPEIDVPIGDAVVTGRVVDAAGEGLAEMRVWIAGETHATFAEPDGHFEIRGLVPGDVTLRARHPGGKAVSLPATAPADGLVLLMPDAPEPGPPEAGSRVRVRFVAVLRGDGPPPTMLTVYTLASIVSVPWTGTGRRRSVEVELPRDPGAARREVTIYAPGLLRWSADLPLPHGGVIDLGDVTLDTGRVIRGTVVDDLGAPIAGAAVNVFRKGRANEAPRMAPSSMAVTRSDGSFTAGGLPHDMDGAWEVIADSPRHAQGSSEVRGEDGDARAQVTLHRLIAVRVVIRDEEGLPIQGAWVRAKALADGRRTTDRAGAADLWLPPGRHSVRAYDPTTAALSAPHVVELTLGNASTEIALSLPRGAILDGRRK